MNIVFFCGRCTRQKKGLFNVSSLLIRTFAEWPKNISKMVFNRANAKCVRCHLPFAGSALRCVGRTVARVAFVLVNFAQSVIIVSGTFNWVFICSVSLPSSIFLPLVGCARGEYTKKIAFLIFLWILFSASSILSLEQRFSFSDGIGCVRMQIVTPNIYSIVASTFRLDSRCFASVTVRAIKSTYNHRSEAASRGKSERKIIFHCDDKESMPKWWPTICVSYSSFWNFYFSLSYDSVALHFIFCRRIYHRCCPLAWKTLSRRKSASRLDMWTAPMNGQPFSFLSPLQAEAAATFYGLAVCPRVLHDIFRSRTHWLRDKRAIEYEVFQFTFIFVVSLEINTKHCPAEQRWEGVTSSPQWKNEAQNRPKNGAQRRKSVRLMCWCTIIGEKWTGLAR